MRTSPSETYSIINTIKTYDKNKNLKKGVKTYISSNAVVVMLLNRNSQYCKVAYNCSSLKKNKNINIPSQK